MDDETPGQGLRRPRRRGRDPLPDLFQQYAAAHEPDTRRINRRVAEGMARVSGDGPRRAVAPDGPPVRRFSVPLAVAAAVAVTALGVPLGLAALSPEPDGPPAQTSATSTTSPTTTAPSVTAGPTVTPTHRSSSSASPSKTAGTPKATSTSAATNEKPAWPKATGSQEVAQTIIVSGTWNGHLTRYEGTGDLGGDPERDDLGPLFELEDGAVIRNVIIGAKAADGIHCRGTCTLENVWWEDVGEDAATLKSESDDDVMTIRGGGARKAAQSVFQHNGPGTMRISDFQVEDFGKLYRACGNCRVSGVHHVKINRVWVTAPGLSVVGINPNLGDTAEIHHVYVFGDPAKSIDICQWYRAVAPGEESPKEGEGPSEACKYSASDVTYER